MSGLDPHKWQLQLPPPDATLTPWSAVELAVWFASLDTAPLTSPATLDPHTGLDPSTQSVAFGVALLRQLETTEAPAESAAALAGHFSRFAASYDAASVEYYAPRLLYELSVRWVLFCGRPPVNALRVALPMLLDVCSRDTRGIAVPTATQALFLSTCLEAERPHMGVRLLDEIGHARVYERPGERAAAWDVLLRLTDDAIPVLARRLCAPRSLGDLERAVHDTHYAAACVWAAVGAWDAAFAASVRALSLPQRANSHQTELLRLYQVSELLAVDRTGHAVIGPGLALAAGPSRRAGPGFAENAGQIGRDPADALMLRHPPQPGVAGIDRVGLVALQRCFGDPEDANGEPAWRSAFSNTPEAAVPPDSAFWGPLLSRVRAKLVERASGVFSVVPLADLAPTLELAPGSASDKAAHDTLRRVAADGLVPVRISEEKGLVTFPPRPPVETPAAAVEQLRDAVQRVVRANEQLHLRLLAKAQPASVAMSHDPPDGPPSAESSAPQSPRTLRRVGQGVFPSAVPPSSRKRLLGD